MSKDPLVTQREWMVFGAICLVLCVGASACGYLVASYATEIARAL